MANTFLAKVVKGKQKKDPNKEWQGLAVEACVDNVVYKGLIFQKADNTIKAQDAVKF